MENKFLRAVLLVFVAVVLVVCSFGGGFVTGHFLSGGTIFAPQANNTNGSQGGTPADLTSLFVPFWNAWNIVHQQYVDQPVDNTKLMQGAISGMMQSLGDPHTLY